MTGGWGAKDARQPFTDQELDPRQYDPRVSERAWVADHMPELRRSAYGQRLLYQSLGFAFVLGLAAHVGGYLLKSWLTTEPFAVLVDLLYALGWAMWTGAVVVFFVEIIPEIKRRQIKRWLDAYEARQPDQTGDRSDQAPQDNGGPTAK